MTVIVFLSNFNTWQLFTVTYTAHSLVLTNGGRQPIADILKSFCEILAYYKFA
jgi:hypothetical protein